MACYRLSVLKERRLIPCGDLTTSRLFSIRSQDFCCEACGCSMRSALLALTPNSNPSAEDHKAKELAQQINFKVRTPALMPSSVTDVTPRRSEKGCRGHRLQSSACCCLASFLSARRKSWFAHSIICRAWTVHYCGAPATH